MVRPFAVVSMLATLASGTDNLAWRLIRVTRHTVGSLSRRPRRLDDHTTAPTGRHPHQPPTGVAGLLLLLYAQRIVDIGWVAARPLLTGPHTGPRRFREETSDSCDDRGLSSPARRALRIRRPA